MVRRSPSMAPRPRRGWHRVITRDYHNLLGLIDTLVDINHSQVEQELARLDLVMASTSGDL
ncbi:hypothetical protein [Neptuniibacter sp. CAU 1671]|uniref:hypothetical protein n=1 Tax=Neptuniibacter sp. CAU 1671 TaxID=3032593 RepID=UPI0023D9D5DF|nr:hypothetical protein [Neptuniibacter sp. CAU 1671]MDF2183014.1 hypothetical protein [Neptuniibacter sp. CAU 1671]